MRPEDFEHLLAAAAEATGNAGLVDPAVLSARTPDLPVSEDTRTHVEKMLRVISPPA